MIRYAVIGTNWISHAFCQAAQATGKLQLAAVYSRSLETARRFSAEYGVVECYDDLQVLAESSDIDAVYIASPNSLHAAQARLFITQGKHVIGEKPLASNLSEVQSLITLAQKHGVVLFEAMKTRYLPNLEICRKALPSLGKLQRAHLTYCQYSSRYQRYLDGENPNTFNPEFSNGSLIDIGIYPLSFAVELFGKPDSFTASGSLLASGVDAHGSLVLNYGDFEVVVTHSKVSDGYAPSEIQGEAGSLLIEHISDCRKVTLMQRGQSATQLSEAQVENTMQYEAAAFADLVEKGCIEHDGLQRTLVVSELSTEARALTGVTYPADN